MYAQLALSLGLAAGLAVAAAGLYLEGKRAGKNECIATAALIDQAATKAGDSAASAAAKQISKIKVNTTTIRQETEREIQTNTVYAECLHSPEQLQRINSALTGKRGPEPAGGGLVPRPGALGGPVLRGDNAEADRGGRAVP